MTRVFGSVFLAFVVTLLASCGGSQRSAGTPNVDVPVAAESYSTEAKSGGVRGGGVASDAEALLEKELEARGDEAIPDGSLADAAAWLLQRAYRQEDTSASSLGRDAVLRFGFAGEFNGWLAGPLDANGIEMIVAQVPKNSVINRYGIVAGQGRDVSLVIGGVRLTLDDFPRSLTPGGSLRLKGEVIDRFQRASVFSTDPTGKVRELRMPGRAIDASVSFADAGVHKLEVMGYGETGPVVLLNVPIHVGVTPGEGEASGTEADPNLTTEEAEATLLSLLNEEREKRHLGRVEPDAELRAVALAHSVDMSEHHFFGHVSPTTGGPAERAAKAKLRVSKLGECVALDASPAGAHRGLLDSPAHRAAMLDGDFTHVGIGVSFETSSQGGRRVVATLLFGRRPPVDDSALSGEQVADILRAQRAARKLPALRVDPTLAGAAAMAARALTAGTVKSAEQALAVSNRELSAAVQRTRVSRMSCTLYLEIIDRYQLSEIPILKRADIRDIGVATATLELDGAAKLAVILIADAGAGKVLKTCD